MRLLWGVSITLAFALVISGCSLAGLDRFPFPGCVAMRCDVLNARDGLDDTDCALWQCGAGGDCVFGPRDLDGDGSVALACPDGDRVGDDCDDLVGGAHPGGTETCNSVDDDCDGVVDEARVSAEALAPIEALFSASRTGLRPFFSAAAGETSAGQPVYAVAYGLSDRAAGAELMTSTTEVFDAAAPRSIVLASTMPPDDPAAVATDPSCAVALLEPLDPPVRPCTTNADCAAAGGGRCVMVADASFRCESPVTHGTPPPVAEASVPVPAPAAGDAFGASVALSGDGTRALVGVPRGNASGALSGRALLFAWDGSAWLLEATLTPTSLSAGAALGTGVALDRDGTTALLGAPGAGIGGSAFVFTRSATTWSEAATLTATGGAAGDELGRSVALSADGSRSLIGAPGDDTAGGIDAGSATTFARASGWMQEATLVAASGAAGDAFGTSVALDGTAERALIGSPLDDIAAIDAGAARVFLRSGASFAEEGVLVAPDAAPADHLGVSVALPRLGTRALVGADLDDIMARADVGSGRVFLRTGTAWAHEASLTISGLVTGTRLGASASISADGEKMLLGAPDADRPGALDAGEARAFVLFAGTWSEESRINLAAAVTNDGFGGGVALSADGTRALIGAPRASRAAGAGEGMASSFALPCSADWQCDDGLVCTGQERCLASGDPSLNDARSCRTTAASCVTGSSCDEIRRGCVSTTNAACTMDDVALSHAGDGEWLVAVVSTNTSCTDGTVRIGHVVFEDRSPTSRYPLREVLGRGPLSRSTSFIGLDLGASPRGCTGASRSGPVRGAAGIAMATLEPVVTRLRPQGLVAYLAAPSCRSSGSCPAAAGVDVEVIGVWLEETGSAIAYVNATGSGIPVALGVSTSDEATSVSVAAFDSDTSGYVLTYPDASGAVAVHVVPALDEPAPYCMGAMPPSPCVSLTQPYPTNFAVGDTRPRTTAPLVVPAAELLFAGEDPLAQVAVATHLRADGSVRVLFAWPSATEIVVGGADLDPATGIISNPAIVTRRTLAGVRDVAVTRAASGFVRVGAMYAGTVVAAETDGGFVASWAANDGTYAVRISDIDDAAVAPGIVRVSPSVTEEPSAFSDAAGRVALVAREGDRVVRIGAVCGE